ncbi:MAG: hypothetical protein ACTSX9_08550 [Candidatus Njordarchaeales archaeon]
MGISEEFSKGFEKVRFYLELMGKKIVDIDERNLVMLIEEVVNGDKIPIEIQIAKPGWVVIRSILMSGDEVQKLVGSTHILYRELLRLSFRFPEFNFAMDDSYNIYIVHYIFLGALSFDVFEEEYHAIPAAYQRFKNAVYPEIKRIMEEEQKIEFV